MKLIKEAKRLQELAGINEIKVEPPKREEYYIYNLDDSEGTEPPLGPFSLNKAKEKLKIYNAGLSYPEWGIIDAEEITTKNNLSTEQAQKAEDTSKEVFLVSKAKKLESFENKTSLTDVELKQLLHLVGFRGQDLVVAWAIAKNG